MEDVKKSIGELQEDVQQAKEAAEDRSLAMDLIKVLNKSVDKMDDELQRKDERLKRKDRIIYALFAVVLIIVGIFTWLWNQYDFTTSIEATGVYAFVDSNNNILAADDLTAEQIESILQQLQEQQKEDK